VDAWSEPPRIFGYPALLAIAVHPHSPPQVLINFLWAFQNKDVFSLLQHF
jgi:hypothetical protein